MITIYSKDGLTVKATTRNFEYNGVFKGSCSIISTIKSESPIEFEIGDYCIYRGERFELNYIPAKGKFSSTATYGDGYIYDNIKFNSLADELTRCDFLDVVLEDNNIHFSSKPDFSFYAASVQDLADRIQANLDRVYTGANKWTVIVSPDAVSSDKNIQISRIKVWDALALADKDFGLNFIIRNRTITIGTAGLDVGRVFGYGLGNGLFDIKQNTNEDALIITRLRAYASTRNMPYRYYNNLKDSAGNPYVLESVNIDNLMLPDFPKTISDPKLVYIDSPNIAKYGVREGSVYFDGSDESGIDIYPSIEGMTAQQLASAGITVSLPNGDNGHIDEVLGADNPTDNGILPETGQGSLSGEFTIYLKDLGFDLSEKDESGQYKYATSETMQISMKSGMCIGRAFDVVEDGITKDTSLGYTRYKVVCKRFVDDSINMAFPNKDWTINAGEKFVLLGIAMPDVYIQTAAQRLLDAAQEYLDHNDDTKYTYQPTIDDQFMANNPSIANNIKEGDILSFMDVDLNIDASVIIQTLKITHTEDKPIPSYDLVLNNDKIMTTVEKMQQSINSLVSNSTGVTIEQVKSLVKSIGTSYFLSKIYDDTAHGNMNFLQNVSIVKDLLVKRNIISEGHITTEQVGSSLWGAGQFGHGWRAWIAENGQSYAEFDNILARREFIVNTLTAAEIKSVGGQILLSLADMVASTVTDGGSYWKVSFNSDNGTIPNNFAIDDQVICRKFNSANIKYYWARVTSVGADYINISKTDKDGSGVPAVDDEIIQFGNRTNTARQSAILLSAYGSDAPSIKQYAGINSYDLTGKEVTVISPSGNKFKGDFTIQSSGESVTTAINDAKTEAINTASTDATNKVNSLSIGSRNYLLETATAKTFTGNGATNQTAFAYNLSRDKDDLSGKICTFSFDWVAEGDNISGAFLLHNRVSPWGQLAPRISISPSNKSGKYTRTFEMQADNVNTMTQLGIRMDNVPVGTTITLSKITLVIGDKNTGWVEAKEDIDSRITNAQTSANTANSLLADIANDNLLIPSEKQDVLKEWNIIQGEYDTVLSQAATYNISSSDYTAKYNALNSYVNPLLTNMSANSIIVGNTFRARFKDYYDAKISLLKSITDKAKQLADAAQSSANNAQKEAEKVRTEYKADFVILDTKIASKVSQTDFNFLDNRVSQTESSITQLSGSITSVVEKVDNIKIGSRNIIPNTNQGKYGWYRMVQNGAHSITETQALGVRAMKATTSVVSTGYNVVYKNLNHSLLKNNTQYVVSFDVYCDVQMSINFLLQADNGTNALTPWYSKTIAKDTWIHVEQIMNTNSTAISNQVLYLQGFNKVGGITIANLKLEEGNKATDWTPAPEDVQSSIDKAQSDANNAQSTANQAKTDATNAQSAATNAQTSANAANNLLTDIANDNKLTPNEKQTTKKEWDSIISEYPKNTAQATKFGVSFAAYTTAYNTLSSYITPLLSNLATTSDINGSTFRSNFKSYYDARTDLLNAISTKAKDLADAAQSAANNAQNAANSKNRTYYQDETPTIPSGGHKVGDLWHKESLVDSSGNINADTSKNIYQLQYRWDGTIWEQINWSVAKSKIEQTDSSISLIVEKTGVNSVGAGSSLFSMIQLVPDQIKLEVSKVQVGGRNYLRSTSTPRTIIGENTSNQVTSGYNFVNGSLEKAGLLEKDITLSCKYKVEGLDKNVRMSFSGDDPYPFFGAISLSPTNSEGKFTYTRRIEATFATSTQINIRVDNLPTYATVVITEMQIEVGNKATDWKAAPEDTQAGIDNAQNTADTAQTNATNANNLLSDISNDNKFTPSEKSETKKEWDAIQSEYTKNVSQASSFSVPSTAYTSAYNALNSYISPLLSNLSTTSDIVGTTFRSRFKAYYDARTDLLNAISTKAKEIADSKTTINEVKAGIKINADGITAFGDTFKVDSTLIANAIQTEELSVGNGNFKVGTDGKISAKGAALEGSLEIGWDGDTSKPVNRITVIDRSSSTQKTKVLITPQNITALSSIGGNTSNPLVVAGGAATSRTVNAGESDILWTGANISLAAGKTYDVVVPEMLLRYSGSTNGIGGFSVYLDNMTTGENFLVVGSRGTIGEYFSINEAITLSGLQAGTYRLRITIYAYGTGSWSSFSIPANARYIVRPITDAVEIGSNGMCGIFTSNKYFHVTTDGYYVRYGDTGFRITSMGIQKSSNMAASTPTWTNI